jgi:hypothetical protein
MSYTRHDVWNLYGLGNKTLEKTEGATEKGQYRKTGNIRHNIQNRFKHTKNHNTEK